MYAESIKTIRINLKSPVNFKKPIKLHSYRKKCAAASFLLILLITFILGILLGAIINTQRAQVTLLSKQAKDFLALCVAEAGMHCVLAEMKADYQFVTHGNPYVPTENWANPAKRRFYLLGNTENLEIERVNRGTYKGKIHMRALKLTAEFRVRVRLINAKNSLETKSIDESHRYFLLESIGKVTDTYKKVVAILEKYLPANYLIYDGQVLDLGGYGPYRFYTGVLRGGRIYGHDMLIFSKRGLLDTGLELIDIEKVSTAGWIKVLKNTFFKSENLSTWLKPIDYNSCIDNFDSFSIKQGNKIITQYVLDGLRGAKSEKFPVLNYKYWLEAQDPKPIILDKGPTFEGFKEAKWRNPAKPNEVVYNLYFGWDFESIEDKVLIYSKVPIRIWGCPKWKALTIFCEKDVYIAGDFNQNPSHPQNYDLGWKDYTETPRNGIDKNSVVIMSLGRIWFDYSNPMLFLRNEMMTVIDYEIAMALGGDEVNPVILASVVYPPKFSSTSPDLRQPMTAINFKVINSLFALPKQPPQVIPATLAGLYLHPLLKKLNDYFELTSDAELAKKRFSIKSFLKRKEIIGKIAAACYLKGFITKGERDKIIKLALDQVEKEIEEEEPNQFLGPWNIADRIYNLAITHPKTLFKFPEMTINALLIDSAEINALWDPTNSQNKVQNELGNISSKEMRSFPFIRKDSNFILRHFGGRMHLRNTRVSEFLSGNLRDDTPVIRRHIWDSTFVRGGGDYFPPYPPCAFNIICWNEHNTTNEEFESF